jgi:hypothetical protein
MGRGAREAYGPKVQAESSSILRGAGILAVYSNFLG